MYSTFYCTHSIGPIIHATGLRPVKVTGFEGTQNGRKLRMGAKSGSFGLEMIELENGGIIKSIHGGLYKNSVWYSMYGSKGNMESSREIVKDGYIQKIYVDADEFAGGYGTGKTECYNPTHGQEDKVEGFGHGGSDYYCMYHFVEKILGNPDADTIDVYEALDMYLPGLFAYFSILDGGKPMAIPNLRNLEERNKYRSDTRCTDPKVAGNMLIPENRSGSPDIPDAIYDSVRDKWLRK